MKEKKIKILWSLVIVMSLLLCGWGTGYTAVTGPCVNCHTMHNSQGGTAMATYGSETGPNSFLTRGSCIGCHAQGGSSKILTIGGSDIPQVYHADSTGDLAGGNFKHIGVGGASDFDNRGHNVVDLFGTGSDGVLHYPPGPINQFHHEAVVTDSNLTCAGTNGCHGIRSIWSFSISGLPALKGAHHGNVDGQLDSADSVSNSYRFLIGVKGLENPTDRWQNVSADSHNEYYGTTAPLPLGCSAGEIGCHGTNGGGMFGGGTWGEDPLLPPGNTISGFCGTCHGNFHGLTGGSGDDNTSDGIGIGGDALSPFRRHPTDIVIKNSGEYAVAKRVYDPDAPVGRTTVLAYVETGATEGDVVTCLSCHAAHATEYPNMLRWNYSGMIAGGGGSEKGCFTCHTQKND